MIPLRFLYRAAKYRWRNDRHELGLIQKTLPRGGTAVDIGCHKGGYLYWMQRWAGPTGQIWAFEPQAILAAYLRRISGGWPQVEIREEAVSSTHQQRVCLILPPGVTKASPGARIGSPANPAGQPVNTVSLDAWFRSRRPPHLIKCDCEGHELEVFQGAEQLLSAHHPALLFECEDRHRGGDGTQPVFDFLHRIGYRGWRIDSRGIVPFLNGRPPPLGGRRPGNNFWFLKA